MKKTLYVMVGIPGSGKSYWANKHIRDMMGKVSYVSRDEVRYSMITEKDEYFSKEKQVYKEFINRIKNDLNEYDTVIADATHINKASRTKLLRALGESLKDVAVIAVVMKVPLEMALERNNKREGLACVPVPTIKRMHSTMTIPTIDEGFIAVWINENGNFFILEESEI